jgi:hypothetical protein
MAEIKKAPLVEEGLCRLVTLAGHMRISGTTLLGSRLVWAVSPSLHVVFILMTLNQQINRNVNLLYFAQNKKRIKIELINPDKYFQGTIIPIRTF